VAAERFGKEAGLFIVSGTMGNLVGVLSQTEPGQEIILDSEAHMFHFEVAGAARIGGLQTRPLPTERGFPSPEQVRAAIRPNNIHVPATGLVCLENTHNRHGGTVSTPEEIAAIARVTHEHGVPVHLDGARIFNAAVALKREAREFAREVDSVQFCLSKGLGAPAGSVLVGARDYIARARRWRKRLGGGLRQVGVLAAPGIVALTEMVDRLAEDHDNARLLAEGLSQLPGIRLDLDRVQTNIVIFRVDPPGGTETLVREALARKVKIHQIGPASIRLVTHKDVDRDDIHRALEVFRELTKGWPRSSR